MSLKACTATGAVALVLGALGAWKILPKPEAVETVKVETKNVEVVKWLTKTEWRKPDGTIITQVQNGTQEIKKVENREQTKTPPNVRPENYELGVLKQIGDPGFSVLTSVRLGDSPVRVVVVTDVNLKPSISAGLTYSF